MNLLITTLGTSWQIVPELLGITNPAQFDFFSGSDEAKEFRKENDIQSVDECWILTTEGQQDLQKILDWAARWGFNLKILVCKGVNTFLDRNELLKMRSLIYRAVFNGSEKADTLYLSLSGGRKTMSADMQEAGNLFGCSCMMHVVDKRGLPQEIRTDNLLDDDCGKYASFFTPLVVSKKIEPSLVVSADFEKLDVKNFPLEFSGQAITYYEEDKSLANEIEERKKRSSQLYANFYSNISRANKSSGGLFRKLYFLHPNILRKLKNYVVGNDKSRDYALLKSFPKAELHSHLGGVLSPNEIIQVALEEKNFVADKANPNSVKFEKTIKKIVSFKDDQASFEKEIYGDYCKPCNFFRIGIDAYQKLGDFQGSALLQTKKTIKKAAELYAQKLVFENVRYVEIRFSPYNYTRLNLSLNQVVDTIMDTLDQYKDKFLYKLICIIGREASMEQIQETVKQINELYETNGRFKNSFVAVDLAGNENVKSPAKLRECFMPFLKNCIHITIHAGETDTVESIWEAVYHLNADRIGHGLKLLDKPELLKHFAEKRIGIEMCPSSNDQIVGFCDKKDSYPLKKYLDEGLKVCVNTDDCGISRTSLANEFIKAAELCPGLTLWDCITLIRNGLEVAFCNVEEKTRLMHLFEDELLLICNKSL